LERLVIVLAAQFPFRIQFEPPFSVRLVIANQPIFVLWVAPAGQARPVPLVAAEPALVVG